MAIVALIGGTLAAGSGLLVLMTWLETSLLKSLAPDQDQRPKRVPANPEADRRSRPMTTAA